MPDVSVCKTNVATGPASSLSLRTYSYMSKYKDWPSSTPSIDINLTWKLQLCLEYTRSCARAWFSDSPANAVYNLGQKYLSWMNLTRYPLTHDLLETDYITQSCNGTSMTIHTLFASTKLLSIVHVNRSCPFSSFTTFTMHCTVQKMYLNPLISASSNSAHL